METAFNLTINDVLKRESFAKAKVIAGEKGLNKPMKWTHIIETGDFEHLINGGELILTTGIWTEEDKLEASKFIEKLIDRQAAGICIELGTHIHSISSETKYLADEHDFPVIVFEETVKFVEITQDIHTLIINKHHHQLSQLSRLSDTFYHLSLAPNGITKILQELNKNLRKNIFLLTDDNSYYYPPELILRKKPLVETLFNKLEKSMSSEKVIAIDEKAFAIQSVKGLGQTWGYLCVQTDTTQSDNFLYSVMDRAALSIAQIFVRNKTIEERKQHAEDEVVQKLIDGKHVNSNELKKLFYPSGKNMYFRIMLIHNSRMEKNIDVQEWEEIRLQLALIIRTTFKQFGFFPSLLVKKDEIVIIAAYISDEKKEEREQFHQVINHIQSKVQHENFHGKHCHFGLSKVHQDLYDSTDAYQQAKNALTVQKNKLSKSQFYEDIGVYRLLSSLQEIPEMENLTNDYLQPLIEYDRKTNSELIRTLEVYLECNGQKKETSEKLFIVRQTLYHRLNKIGELIGEDFMEPEKRLALELGLKIRNARQVDLDFPIS